MFAVTMGGVSSSRCDNVTGVTSVAKYVRGRRQGVSEVSDANTFWR